MLTRDQYVTLNGIRERTDTGRKVTVMLASYKDFELLQKWSFIEGGIDSSSTITFPGRVALAVYEEQSADN